MSKRIASLFLACAVLISAAPFAFASPINDVAYQYTKSPLAKWMVHAACVVVGAGLGGTTGTILIPGFGTVDGAALGAAAGSLSFDRVDQIMETLAADSSYVSEEEYISTNNLTSVEYSSNVFTKTLYLGGTGSLACESFAMPFDNSYVVSFSSGLDIPSFSISKEPYYDSSTHYINFSLHCFKSGYVLFGGVTNSFSPSVDCSVEIYYPTRSSSNYMSSFCEKYGTGVGGRSWCFLVDDTTGSVKITYATRNGDWMKTDLIAGHSYHVEYCVGFSLYFNSGNAVSDYSIYTPYISGFPVRTAYDPSGNEAPDSSTRTATITQTINNYNIQDNSTKYYIGTVDNSNNVTNVYSPNIFDEQTLVYTEPVTGQQIQCTGWKYNYLSGLRGYGLTLTPGTYTHDGADITSLALIYDDDALHIYGYTAEALSAAQSSGDYLGNATFTENYAYVVATSKEAEPEPTPSASPAPSTDPGTLLPGETPSPDDPAGDGGWSLLDLLTAIKDAAWSLVKGIVSLAFDGIGGVIGAVADIGSFFGGMGDLKTDMQQIGGDWNWTP